MNAVLDQGKMMLTYPQPAMFRPTFLSHGMVQQKPMAQFPSYPLAIAPTTILHTQLHHSFPTLLPSAAHSKPVQVAVPTSPSSHSPKSPPAPKQTTHSSFSIDSILGKRDSKTSSSDCNTKVPVSPIANGSSPRTNGLMYFYTPGASQQPCSPFPFATAPRPFDHEMQRSPLGSMVLSSGKHWVMLQVHLHASLWLAI